MRSVNLIEDCSSRRTLAAMALLVQLIVLISILHVTLATVHDGEFVVLS